jgi:hypothetical protein
MILKDYLENNGKTLDILVQENYRSLGMNNTSFNPLEKFDKIEFRQQKWILIGSNFTRLC